MMLANLCWQCGDIGLSGALVDCLQCHIARRHSYCLEEIPEDLSGEISWLCEDCRVQPHNSASKASHQVQHPTAAVRTGSGLNNVSSHLKRETSSCNTGTSDAVRSSACLGLKEDEIGGYVKEKPKRRKSSPTYEDELNTFHPLFESEVKGKARLPKTGGVRSSACLGLNDDELDNFHPQVEAKGASKSLFPKTVSPRKHDHGSGRTKIGLNDPYRESCSVNGHLLNPQDQHPAAAVRIGSSLNTDSHVSNDLLRKTSSCNTGALGAAVGSSACLSLKEDEVEHVKEKLRRRKLCLPNEGDLENFHPLVEGQDTSCLMGHERHTAGQAGTLNSQINIPCQLKSLPMPSHFWSGCFYISNKRFGPFKAHLSVRACKKVCDVAKQLPLDLHMQKLPRLDAWPKSFKTSPPTDDNIALFFLPLCDRVETVLDVLLDDIINNDLMLRFQFDEVELLIFSSIVLPREHQIISGKYYPWGVFRPRIVQECSASEGSQANSNGVDKGIQVANPNRLEKGIQVGENIKDDVDNDETFRSAKESGRVTTDCLDACDNEKLQAHGRKSSGYIAIVSQGEELHNFEKLVGVVGGGSLSEKCTLGPKEVAEEREVRVDAEISRERVEVFKELEEGEICEDDEYATELQYGIECQSELNELDKVGQLYEEKQHMSDLGISREGQKASSESEVGEICNDECSDEVSKEHAEDDLPKEKQRTVDLVVSRERPKSSEDTLGWEICDDVCHGDSINSEQCSLQLFPTVVEDMAIAVRMTARKDDIDLEIGLGLPTFDNHNDDAGGGTSEKHMLLDSSIFYQ